MAIDKGMASGSLGLMILHLLNEADMYGYQIVKELSARSEQAFEMKEGTLYPLLHTMEREGWVEAYSLQGDNVRLRKYYRLTDGGRGVLEAKRAEWQYFTRSVNKVIGNEAFAN